MAGEIKFKNVGYTVLEQMRELLWLHLYIFYRFGFTLTSSNYIHFKFIFFLNSRKLPVHTSAHITLFILHRHQLTWHVFPFWT